MIAKVIFDLSLDRPFDYLVPETLRATVRVGSRVRVPFGHSGRDGYILALTETADFAGQLKSIESLAGTGGSIPEKLIELGRWIADYYCSTYEQAIRTLLPAVIRHGKMQEKTRRIYTIADAAAVQKFLSGREGQSERARGRRLILELLSESGNPLSLDELKIRLDTFSASSLTTLVKNKLVSVSEEAVRRDAFEGVEFLPSTPLPPTPDQQAALKTVSEMLHGQTQSHVLLLHGVTNSGKTEVYLQAIAETLALGKSAIVLVPEISLTPQTVRRFRARFGDALSVLHSRLSDGERFDEWNRINSGSVKIAVGARSALFAPFRNLGLIIVDEEHESSYKQSEAPRYHARDVAVMRGQLEHACVILGSATPSAETLHNARTGRFLLAEMKTQVESQPPPHIELCDLRRMGAPQPGQSTVFSPRLVAAVRERLARGEQTILFLNRRGYARVFICEECGYEARCTECSTALVYSKQQETLRCHLCGCAMPAPQECPQCHSPKVRYGGTGTEKLEAIAAALFHGARIARMDSDTMRSQADYQTTLDRFRRGEIDILIGTQMIAKGLHFPSVTLVGIINIDYALAMNDFRAPEHTFQLITQVAGRAGRGDIPGEVILQTRLPQNETIQFAARQDFEGFSRFDLEFRELMHYPPFARLIAVYVRGDDETATAAYAKILYDALTPYRHEEVVMTEPAPAPLERIKGKFRYLFLIKGNQLKVIRQALRILLLHRIPPAGVDAYADIDAQTLL